MKATILISFCFCVITSFAQTQKPAPNNSVAQKVIVPCRCGQLSPVQWGFCDSISMTEAVKCQFDSAFKFNGGLARVIKNGKTGYADNKGKLIIPFQFDAGLDFSDGFAFVRKDNNDYYINKTGVNVFKKNFTLPAMPKIEGASESVKKMMAGQEYEARRLCRFSEGMAVFVDTIAKKLGYIDLKGAVALPAKYLSATRFLEGLAFVMESPGAPLSCINKKGIVQFTLPEKVYVSSEGFENGFAVVLDKKGYNYVKKDGKLLLAESVTKAGPFKDGFAVVNRSGDAQLINSKGETVIGEPMKYLGFTATKNIFYYSNNTDRGFGFIDANGKRRTKAIYDDFKKLNDTLYACKLKGTSVYTLLSLNNGELINSFFTQFSWVESGKLIRLEGQSIMGDYSSLDYDVLSGKFMKDKKELAAKENYYLRSAEDRQKDLAELGGVIKYENNHFTLRFAKEMELYKKEEDKTIFRNSTFYFSIIKRKFKGSSDDYLNSMLNELQSKQQYESVEKRRVLTASGNFTYLLAVEKKKTGEQSSKLFYLPIDNSNFGIPDGEMYVIFGNYFVIDEKIHGLDLLQALQSIKKK